MRYALLVAVLAGCAPMQPIAVPRDAGVSFVIRHRLGGLHSDREVADAADKPCATMGLKARRAFADDGGWWGWWLRIYSMPLYFVAPVPFSAFECAETIES